MEAGGREVGTTHSEQERRNKYHTKPGVLPKPAKMLPYTYSLTKLEKPTSYNLELEGRKAVGTVLRTAHIAKKAR